MDIWSCDGCDVTGTEREVVAHIEQASRTPEGKLKEIEDVTCWGAMKVGGPAWLANERGVRPMELVLDEVAGAFARHAMRDL